VAEPNPLHILILEDSPTDAELMKFELQEAGLSFTAKVVWTEKDYINELKEFTPDLILSDYDLPTYLGSSALAEAKRRCPYIPFILVTGAIVEDRAIEILIQGAKDYVLKNRLQQKLVPAVRRVLVEAEEQKALKKAEAELRKAHTALEAMVTIRTAELKAERAARKKMEQALRKIGSRESTHVAKLRKRAIERMKANRTAAGPSTLGADTEKLLQELQIYQIELEMQNEELKESKIETEALLAKYLDIYDFSPIGYITLNQDGTILQANLTGSSLLGVERSRLIGQKFRFYVSEKFHPIFKTFFTKMFGGETIKSCEVKLENREGPSHFVQLRARLSEGEKECLLSLIEITERSRDEAPSRNPEHFFG
jgi:PAS domain S-box-containing protein